MRYDAVLALSGTGSYLTDDELERIPFLLRPGRPAAAMFYDPDHTPQPSVETGVVPRRSWALGLFPGEIRSGLRLSVPSRSDDHELQIAVQSETAGVR